MIVSFLNQPTSLLHTLRIYTQQNKFLSYSNLLLIQSFKKFTKKFNDRLGNASSKVTD